MKRFRYAMVPILLVLGHALAFAVEDPRFFGTYCGDATVKHCVKYKYWFFGWHYGTKCKNIQFKNIKAKLDHVTTAKGGVVNGSGTATVEGDSLAFVLAGAVTGHGLVKGSATVTGWNPHYGVAKLSSDGMALTVYAYNKTLTARKDQCGNTPPKVAITSLPQGPIQYGQTHYFSGTVVDAEDLATPMSKFAPERLNWTYDDTGALTKRYDGLVAWTNTLPPGSHKITFSATDSGGLSASVSGNVTVTNQGPDIPTIFLPRTTDVLSTGCLANFLGQAYDMEDGWIPGPQLKWSSNIDGTIGVGANVAKALSTAGNHTIRLTATDSVGVSAFTEHTVTVKPAVAGCPPLVRITRPEYWKWKGMAVLTGEKQTFKGAVLDEKDLPNALQVEWKAIPISPAGPAIVLGTDVTVTTTKLTAIGGKPTQYTIRLTATDTDGNQASDQMLLVVLSQPIL